MFKIVSRHDGLTQETKSALIHKYPSFHRHVVMHLPLFLTMDVWVRHDYSLIDIQTTLEYFSPKHLWQLALLYGISSSNSAIKLAFSNPETMVYGSKAIVIRKIMKILHDNYTFKQSGSVLDTERKEHIPPIPIHKISENEYKMLLSCLPDSVDNLLDVVEISNKYSWRNIYLAPIRGPDQIEIELARSHGRHGEGLTRLQ